VPSPNMSNEQVLDAVISRATKDSEFRAQLLTDPRTAIQTAFGVVIPPDFRVRFIERGPDTDALIVLPAFRGMTTNNAPDGALSDDELESVSGGAAHAHHAWSRTIPQTHAQAHGGGHPQQS
jgi:hypothetical protein